MQMEQLGGLAEAPAAVRRWRAPRSYYRPWYAEWEEHALYRALSPSAQAIYRLLWTYTGGQYHVRMPASVGRWKLGLCERTWFRAVRALENRGLLEVEHGGGAHASCNRFRARALTTSHAVREAPPKPGRPAAPPVVYVSGDVLADGASRAARRDGAPSGEYSTDAELRPSDGAGAHTPSGEVLADAGSRAARTDAPSALQEPDAPPPLPERGPMPAGLLAQLVEAWIDDTREERDAAAAALEGMDAPSRWALAEHYGLVGPQVAPVAPLDGLRGRGLARELVARFLRRFGVEREPWPSEVNQALALVRHVGPEAAAAKQEEAVGRMVRAVVHWRGRNRPRGYGYLWMHLVALKAVPPPGDDEDDEPPS